MAANGISTLETKELRQQAKLALAASNRASVGNERASYDISQLPTVYSGNDVVDNVNDGGLIEGRPWINSGTNDSYIMTESNDNLTTESVDALITE